VLEHEQIGTPSRAGQKLLTLERFTDLQRHF
jgi:hypothetical protein